MSPNLHPDPALDAHTDSTPPRCGARALRSLLSAGLALVALFDSAHAAPTPRLDRRELRGVWIASTESEVFRSRAAIAEAMDFLADHNINVVFPDVWYAGMTLHPSRVLEETLGIAQDPRYAGRDPLAELLVEAHIRGIEVMPWFESGFTAARGSEYSLILEKKPDWAARNREGGVLERNGTAWLNLFDPDVQAFVSGLVLEVARNYDIDGVQGDDRLPAMPIEGGYDASTTSAWHKDKRLAPPAPSDARWTAWRAGRLTDFLAHLTRDLHEVSPGIVMSSSPNPYRWGLDEFLQDSKSWLERGLVDLFHPQCYRRESINYKQIADEQFAIVPRNSRTIYAPAILIQSGAWRIEARELVEMIEYNRDRGFGGEVLFHFGGLRANDGELARALSAGPYLEPARVPHRRTSWRPKAREIAPRGLPGPEAWSRESGRLRAESAGETEVVYLLDAPATGWFQLLLEVPESAEIPARVRRSFVGSDVPEATVALQPGLVALGGVRLDAGRPPIELHVRTVPGEKGRLAVGRALILIDRKRSPDVVWRD